MNAYESLLDQIRNTICRPQFVNQGTAALIAAVIGLLAYYGIKRHRRFQLFKKYGIPGPEPSFWTGNLSDLTGQDKVNNRNVSFNKWVKQYGKIYAIFDPQPCVVVADVELVKRIQAQDFSLFSMRHTYAPKGGFDADTARECHILSTDITPQKWREIRNLTTPALTPSKIKGYVPLVTSAVDDFLMNIEEASHLPEFDIADLFQRLTMDTIGRAAFGVRLDVQTNPQNPLFLACKAWFEDLSKQWRYFPFFAGLVFPELFQILYPVRVLQRKVLDLLGRPSHWKMQNELCMRIVKDRKSKLQDPNNPSARNDLLNSMLEACLTDDKLTSAIENAGPEASGKIRAKTAGGRVYRMTETEAASNASILFGTFETNSTIFSFLVHVIVNHPKVQDEMRREINELFDRDGVLDSNTNSLTYVEAVVYETMRVYPPANQAVTRQSTVDYEFNGITIPADVKILIPAVILHRDPDLWPEPEKFDPMRFYGEEKIKAAQYSFQGFGGGSRVCPGISFSMMQAKITLARLLHRFRLIRGPSTQSYEQLTIEYKPITTCPTHVYVKAVPVSLK